MKKVFENGVEIEFNFNKKQIIRVEGLGYYTIIDMGTVSTTTYALLESWDDGEDDMCVIMMPRNIMWLEYDNDRLCFKNGNRKCLFIPARRVVVDAAYNSLTSELTDAGYIVNDDELEYWTEEEMEVI